MRINVLLFGPAADAAKTRSLSVLIEAPQLRCDELCAQLATLAPALARFLPSSRVAVNHAFVGDDYLVKPDDEVALIGMVSGG